MGTSQSSNGPGSGQPIVPPWVPDLPSSQPTGGGGAPLGEEPQEEATEQNIDTQPAIAPARRFAGMRLNAGNFAKSGDSKYLKKALHHYVKTGYQGAGNATKRHGGTIRTASALYDILSNPTSASTSGEARLDQTSLEGRSADEVMDAIVEATRPVDGTQDAETSRGSIKDSLSELLSRYPEADLLNLNEEQRLFSIELYLSAEIYRRFDLDLGTTIQDKAADARDALSKLKEVKDYIRETVAASFKKMDSSGQRVDARTVGQIIQNTLQDVFQVFESYSQ